MLFLALFFQPARYTAKGLEGVEGAHPEKQLAKNGDLADAERKRGEGMIAYHVLKQMVDTRCAGDEHN